MEPPKNELQVVPNMIMCGDHRSITKTELNAKEPKPKEEKAEDLKKFTSYGTIAPSSSRTERAVSEHVLRAQQARRRARSLELAERAGPDACANRALIHAAIGSFRWPPYLLCVWVLVLVLTHALHCLVAALDRALPPLRGACQCVRACAERRWRGEGGREGAGAGAWRAGPLALTCAAGALYALHAALSALRAAALWALEPLGADADALLADYDREEEAPPERL